MALAVAWLRRRIRRSPMGAPPPRLHTIARTESDGDVRLAVLGELGPVGGDALVVVELAAVGEHMGTRGGDALGPAPAHREGVALPRVALAVATSAPQIDD